MALTTSFLNCTFDVVYQIHLFCSCSFLAKNGLIIGFYEALKVHFECYLFSLQTSLLIIFIASTYKEYHYLFSFFLKTLTIFNQLLSSIYPLVGNVKILFNITKSYELHQCIWDKTFFKVEKFHSR